MFDEPFVKNVLTPVLAVIGAFTGVTGTVMSFYNLWLSRKSHTTKVRVRPYFASTSKDMNGEYHDIELGIEIVNQSYFAVVVTEIGLIIKESSWKKKRYLQLGFRPPPKMKIEPRDKASAQRRIHRDSILKNGEFFLYSDVPTFPTVLHIKGAYVKLATGHRISGMGDRKAMSAFIEVADSLWKKYRSSNNALS